MNQPFDIFLRDRDGDFIWQATANSLDEAKVTVERLTKTGGSGTEFVIFNQTTQESISIKPAVHPTKAA